MWEILGSWPVVIAVFLVGAAALEVAARRTGRRLLACGVLVVATLGAAYFMVIPPVVDGTQCVSGATPGDLDRADVDRHVERALREAGLEVDLYACRDMLRKRYLVIGLGYLVVTLGGAVLLTRLPLSASAVPSSHRPRSRWWSRR